MRARLLPKPMNGIRQIIISTVPRMSPALLSLSTAQAYMSSEEKI